MKLYLYILFFGSFCFIACASKEKQKTVDTNKKPSLDLRLMGFENLKASMEMKDILCQSWNDKEDVINAKDVDITSDIEIPYRGYCFFTDGTVVKDPRGYLKTGTWSLNGNVKPITIAMTFDNGEKELRHLAYLMPYEMILASINGSEKTTSDFNADAIRHININEDPFYKDNISWRIKPSAPESDKAIKQRLKDCVHFFVLFYDEKINAGAESVSFIGLPSCYNWYSGGIILQKEPELQKKWINCFYNMDQAMKAYKLADKLISQQYNWPKNESNWLKLNVTVLKQMEKRIDSIN